MKSLEHMSDYTKQAEAIFSAASTPKRADQVVRELDNLRYFKVKDLVQFDNLTGAFTSPNTRFQIDAITPEGWAVMALHNGEYYRFSNAALARMRPFKVPPQEGSVPEPKPTYTVGQAVRVASSDGNSIIGGVLAVEPDDYYLVQIGDFKVYSHVKFLSPVDPPPTPKLLQRSDYPSRASSPFTGQYWYDPVAGYDADGVPLQVGDSVEVRNPDGTLGSVAYVVWKTDLSMLVASITGAGAVTRYAKANKRNPELKLRHRRPVDDAGPK